MKMLLMDAFTKFECIGGVCPDTCCIGWNIYIDPHSMKNYRSVPGKFGEELCGKIKINDRGIGYFELDTKQRCPFLNEENWCRIYRELGPDALCTTCRDYPRIVYQAGDIQFAVLTISCPEVGRMLLSGRERQKIVFLEDERKCDINHTDWGYFNEIIRVYTTLHNVLQERQFRIRERLSASLVYVWQVYDSIPKGVKTEKLTELFMNPDLYANCRCYGESESHN